MSNMETKVIHQGNEADHETGAVIPPIYQTTTYKQSSPGDHKGYEYTRTHNPTRTRLESCLASLENARFALTTSSGMSAETLIMHMLPKGSRIICGDDVYGGTYRLMNTVFHDRHEFTFVDTTDLNSMEKAMKKHSPHLIWIETPTNPLLKITSIKEISRMAEKYNSVVVVDNTFMSPVFQNPLSLGAHIVVHSMSKYINGHSDVIGGVIMLDDDDTYEKLWTLQNSIGPTLSPFDSWLVLRGVKTLAVRMKAHEENADLIARFLTDHSKVDHVIYPGLSHHPQHEIAKKTDEWVWRDDFLLSQRGSPSDDIVSKESLCLYSGRKSWRCGKSYRTPCNHDSCFESLRRFVANLELQTISSVFPSALNTARILLRIWRRPLNPVRNLWFFPWGPRIPICWNHRWRWVSFWPSP